MICKITSIILNPEERQEHVKELLKIDGLNNIAERADACYCSLPLTGVPENQRETIAREHEVIKQAIKEAGIDIWDPKEAAGNPWTGITHRPEEIYDGDTVQVVTPRFFEFTNVAPSTGGGIEQHKAIAYNKIAVVITKAGTYTSRMSTGARRIVLLEYQDIEKQKDDIRNVFRALRVFNPGIGICNIHGNTLLGFKDEEEPVCLKGIIEAKFPHLTYNFEKYIVKN